MKLIARPFVVKISGKSGINKSFSGSWPRGRADRRPDVTGRLANDASSDFRSTLSSRLWPAHLNGPAAVVCPKACSPSPAFRAPTKNGQMSVGFRGYNVMALADTQRARAYTHTHTHTHTHTRTHTHTHTRPFVFSQAQVSLAPLTLQWGTADAKN